MEQLEQERGLNKLGKVVAEFLDMLLGIGDSKDEKLRKPKEQSTMAQVSECGTRFCLHAGLKKNSISADQKTNQKTSA